MLLAGCPGQPDSQDTAIGSKSLKDARLSQPVPAVDDGSWTMATRDHANHRFSALRDIDTRNVARLEQAWDFEMGSLSGEEAAPLVVGNTMWVVTPFPNKVFALDLDRPGTVKWRYDAKVLPQARGVACCDVVNRGAVYDRGRIIFNALDAQTIALDAATGQELWTQRLGDVQKGETMTMAPMVVGDLVLVGNSGGELGVRGWLAALDVATGQVRWKAYSTGADSEVLIGPEFKPFYAGDRGKDLGMTTWPPGRWETGGGTVWGFLAYDPVLDLIYYGTSNPGPWNPEERPGDNKWTAGVFARRPQTGQAVWFYQWSPHDVFDHDGVNEMVLVDMEIRGQLRHVLLHADRNGYFYVLDRQTGEVLSAEPFEHITTSQGVDLVSGRLRAIEAKSPKVGRVSRDLCPASPGAKDWQPMSFSPATGLVYIPHNHLCQDTEATEVGYIAGTPYVGANVIMKPGPGGHRGGLIAWDPATGKPVWHILEKFPAWSGTLATAGDLVFYGTMDGRFRAVHARTGEVLWERQLESGIIGQPVTYRGPDGKQYVAVLSGVGGWAGAVVSGNLDTRDRSAALGFVAAMWDLPKATKPGGRLHVFAVKP